jgi:Holliday junction resolvasome RuvABC DNA-binding subunit
VGTEGDRDLPVGESPPADARACSKLDAAIVSAQSKQALMGLGWKPAIANAAVAAALEKLGPAVPLEQLIFEALRQCPRPSA